MCVYLRAKFEVSRVIIINFRQGVILPILSSPPPPPPPPQSKPRKTPPRLGLKPMNELWVKLIKLSVVGDYEH